MKKVLLVGAIILLTTGCGADDYNYECKKVGTNEAFKKTEIIKIGIDDKKVYKLDSNITEEHTSEDSVNNAYANYQNLYNNYNENNVKAEYKKNEKKLIATYHLDKSDIDNMKIELPYDFSLEENKFIKSVEDLGFECKEK
ncbi:MAG: hypothetical protein J6B98_07155 [Bacilli bacterium]|nr:hypothetical protein [Bacilli bacterium]